MAQAKPPSVRIDVSGTRHAIVRRVAEEMKMTIVESEMEDCDLYWIDSGVPLEKYLQLKPYQMINHFSGMGEISRKDALAKNIQKMKQVHSVEYDILPRTWVLPSEYNALSNFMKESRKRRKSKTYIIKPHNSSMGNGISLARSMVEVPQGENVIVQEYVDNPLLLDGFKFDLRVYVLVTSCFPLRIFIYNDGLVRLSTEKYETPTDSNIHKNFMHLTNYSINKHSESFDHHEDFDKGSKRSLKYLNGWLTRNRRNAAELWLKIHDLVVKTMIVVQPHLKHSYQACRPGCTAMDKCQSFEILGFDILLDETLKPWLLEVNRSPSFGIDAEIDLRIKTGVITDALRLADIRPAEKQKKPSTVTLPKSMSHRRLQSLTKTLQTRPRSPLDFTGEIEDACQLTERKIEEIKYRLSLVRKEKEMEQFEEQNQGDYKRIFPSHDPIRQMAYDKLLADSARICFSIRPETRNSVVRGLDKMKERELVELLDQYESDEITHCLDSHGCSKSRLKPMRPLVLRHQSPLEAEFQAMAAREYEEEQTQRTMLSLNALEPSYPGKNNDEVKKIIEQVWSNWVESRSKVGTFWLNTLDSTKRKQLLCPMRDTIRTILHSHWRTAVLDLVRLHKVFLRLFNFFLSNHGQGLWCTFPGGGVTAENWEKVFKRKTDVLSITEMYCCRRVVELVQGTVIAAHHYYEKQMSLKKSNPPPLLRRTTALSRRPLTVSQQQRVQPYLVQQLPQGSSSNSSSCSGSGSNNGSGSNGGRGRPTMKSVSYVNNQTTPTHSFSRISSTALVS